MGWFGTRGGLEGLVGVSGFAVSAPPKPVEPVEAPLPDPFGYDRPPRKRSSLKIKLALLGSAGLIFLGGVGGAYFLFSGGQRGVAVPAVTPTVSPRPTPTVDLSYYEPQPTPTLTPVRIPTPTHAMVLPTPVPTTTPYFVPTAYFFPTAEPTETPTPVPTPTKAPTPVLTPTLSLEERARLLVKELNTEQLSGKGRIIKNYSEISPIVEAVFKEIGLRYDNIEIYIRPNETFAPSYCDSWVLSHPNKDMQTCFKLLEEQKDLRLAFAIGNGAWVREGKFYTVITSAIREGVIAAGMTNHNAKSYWAAEVAGVLGASVANITLAEKLDYDPHNDISDTVENRVLLSGFLFGDDVNGKLIRSTWLIFEAMGYLDRSKSDVMMTKGQASEGLIRFLNLPDPEAYANGLLKSHDKQKDSEWVREVLLFRINPNKKTPTGIEKAVLFSNPDFYTPLGSPSR